MKVGVVGAGVIGNRFGRVFSEIEDVEIKWICDIDKTKAEQYREKFGGIATDNYDDLLKDEEVDFIYIGVPPKFHRELTLKALEAGKDVICEKPIAVTVDEAKEMENAASNSGRLTAINLPFRYTEGVQKLKEYLRSDFTGEIRRVALRFRFPRWPREWQNVDWLKGKEQGGPLREVGTHFFFLLWELSEFLGKPKRVLSLVEFPDSSSAETSVAGIIELDTGIVCTVDLITGGREKEENSMIITGDKNMLSFESWYLLRDMEGNTLCDTYKSAEKQMVLDFVRRREEKLVSFTQARQAQEILQALLTSDGKWISIS